MAVERSLGVVVERTLGDSNARPDPPLRRMISKERFGNTRLVEERCPTIGLVSSRNRPLIAPDAIDLDSDLRLSALGRQDPWPIAEGWVVTNVAAVSACEIRDPFRVRVLVERNDRAIHIR